MNAALKVLQIPVINKLHTLSWVASDSDESFTRSTNLDTGVPDNALIDYNTIE